MDLERINVEGLKALTLKTVPIPEPLSLSEIQVEVSEAGKGNKPICILCESGYHDSEWEILHIMQCGCPCHRGDICA